ncbi:DUF2577 domain-containing protein [Sporosarcina sp. P17b]|uniref:DUF2577 domain-containing protein n=1 Tax=Sporosarcina sp. P17b TaxID=2048260 RepID=UPI000C165BA3|nr:DUF2577 domain-containing protein [Sporosarcina sp. P17b]PIC72537.1 hypothetical protein CSV76_15020 [Sporosarcina sp. P17b]
MLDIIKRNALKGVNANSPVELMGAIVTQAPPELTIQLKNDSKLPIPKEIIIVAEHLTRHKRKVQIKSSDIKDFTMSPDKDVHGYEAIDITEAEVTFLDELKAGDEVLVTALQGGQAYYIADRVVRYE